MAVCTFFGHRDCPETIKPYLREVLIDLINNQEVDTFYVGNRGGSMESCAVSCGNWHRNTRRFTMLWCWPICRERRTNTMISLTPSSRRELKPSIPTTQFLGETVGCCKGQIMWLPTSPTPGAVRQSSRKRQNGKGKPWSIFSASNCLHGTVSHCWRRVGCVCGRGTGRRFFQKPPCAPVWGRQKKNAEHGKLPSKTAMP